MKIRKLQLTYLLLIATILMNIVTFRVVESFSASSTRDVYAYKIRAYKIVGELAWDIWGTARNNGSEPITCSISLWKNHLEEQWKAEQDVYLKPGETHSIYVKIPSFIYNALKTITLLASPTQYPDDNTPDDTFETAPVWWKDDWTNYSSLCGSVGGIVVSVDKFGLLTPYIVFASAFFGATSVIVLYVKHVKRRKVRKV